MMAHTNHHDAPSFLMVNLCYYLERLRIKEPVGVAYMGGICDICTSEISRCRYEVVRFEERRISRDS